MFCLFILFLLIHLQSCSSLTFQVRVQMMRMEEDVSTYIDQEIHTSVLHLPFNNSYSMLLLLPDNMTLLENNICPAEMTIKVGKKNYYLFFRKYNIFVPKFSIKTSYKLNDVLTGMGMTDMFGDRANLSGIAEGQNLAVSEVVHKATLDVDETGATAAAVTGIGITLLSLRIIPELKFNRPFMAIIIERNTNEMLFIACQTNPLNQG
uniref:Thyroxine-binding globulin n=1 Tax=Cyprinodon variegatus TaxID=28743 RepID=A0A3Q2CBS9_CYPVA